MRTVPFFCVVLLAVSMVSSAQTIGHDVSSADAVIPVVPIWAQSDEVAAINDARTVTTIDEVVFWPVVMPDGHTRTDVFVNESSVIFNGNCAAVDQMSTRELFDEIALAAIDKGLTEGWMECTTDCTGSNVNVRIWTAACVERTGSGCSTEFQTCDTTTRAWRDYEVCCDGNQGAPTITLVAFGSQAQDCGGGNCESTVPQAPPGGMLY